MIVAPTFFPTTFHPAVFSTSLALGTVTHLDLSWNDLGVEGGKAILDGMQAWSRLCVTRGKKQWGWHMLLSESQCFGPFGFTWSIGKIAISDPPPAIPCMCQVSIIFCIWKANHSLIDCQLSGNRIAEAVGVVVLGTGVSAETFRWVKVYHGLPGLDRWVAA